MSEVKRVGLPEVLCVGETMAMVTPADGRQISDAKLFSVSSGGAESNVARHLASHGIRAAWLSALGTDALGDRVVGNIAASGVDTRWVIRDPNAITGVYFKDPGAGVHYYRAHSAARRLAPDDVGRWPVDSARWVHISGITAALSDDCHQMLLALLNVAHAAGVPVSFDVNYRQPLWSTAAAAPVLHSVAERADVVLVGRDEAEDLWGTQTSEDVAALLPGVRRLVVKDGDIEAVEFDRTKPGKQIVTRVPARKVEVVEAVGAGDAFAAGYLSSLLRHQDAAARLALGHSLAAWVLGSPEDYRDGHGLDPHL